MPEGLELYIPRMTRLEIARRHKGYSIEELARESRVSGQTIKKHEQGIRDIYTYKTIYKLRDVLGVEQSYLVWGKMDIWDFLLTCFNQRPQVRVKTRLSRTVLTPITSSLLYLFY